MNFFCPENLMRKKENIKMIGSSSERKDLLPTSVPRSNDPLPSSVPRRNCCEFHYKEDSLEDDFDEHGFRISPLGKIMNKICFYLPICIMFTMFVIVCVFIAFVLGGVLFRVILILGKYPIEYLIRFVVNSDKIANYIAGPLPW